jgi:hypothetical protein
VPDTTTQPPGTMHTFAEFLAYLEDGKTSQDLGEAAEKARLETGLPLFLGTPEMNTRS